MLHNLLSDSYVSKKHKLLDHEMRVNMLVLRGVRGILAVDIKFELYFRRRQCQGSLLIPSVSKCPCNCKQSPQPLGKLTIVLLVINYLLSRVIIKCCF